MLCAHSILWRGWRQNVHPSQIPPNYFPTAPPSIPQVSIFPTHFGLLWRRAGSREFGEHPQPPTPIPELSHSCPANLGHSSQFSQKDKMEKLWQISPGAGAGMQQRRALLRAAQAHGEPPENSHWELLGGCSPWESQIPAFPPGGLKLFAFAKMEHHRQGQDWKSCDQTQSGFCVVPPGNSQGILHPLPYISITLCSFTLLNPKPCCCPACMGFI